MRNLGDATASTEPRLWTRNYRLLLSANTLIGLGFYMLPPTLPAHVKHSGGSPLETSLVVGLFSIFSLVFRSIGGNAADSGDEKELSLLGALIVLASTLSLSFLPVKGILISRMVQGIGWGLGTAAIATGISASVAPERRGEGIGYYSLTMIAATGITPVFAIPAMNRWGFPAIAILSSLLVASGIAALCLTSPSGHSGGRGRGTGIDWRNLFERNALLPSALCILTTMTICGVIIYMMLYGEEIGLKSISVFFLGFTAMLVATRPFAGRVFDRRGHFAVVLPGAILMIAGLVALSRVHSLGPLILASLLYGAGYGAVHPSLQAWAIARSAEGRRGAANGTFLSAMDLSYFVGSIFLGAVAHGSSFSFMYFSSSFFVAAMLALYLLALWRERQ